MEPLIKAGFVTVRAVVRLRLSSFLAETCCSAGIGTRERVKNSWPIQSRLLPHRKPSPYPLCLAHQHPQTHTGDLAPFLSPLFAASVSPGCLLSLDLVNSINKTDKTDWSEQLLSKIILHIKDWECIVNVCQQQVSNYSMCVISFSFVCLWTWYCC